MAETKTTAKTADIPQKAAQDTGPDATPGSARPRTIDSAERSRGWTTQSGPKPIDPEAIPGNVVTEAELPDPEVQKAFGIDPASANAGLVVVHDEDERLDVRNGDMSADDVDFGEEGPRGSAPAKGRLVAVTDESERDARPGA